MAGLTGAIVALLADCGLVSNPDRGAVQPAARLISNTAKKTLRIWVNGEDLMSIVECITLYNERIFLPRAKLVFRPSAYAVILHEDKVLLVNTRSTGKYSLPGGGVDLGERLENALRREVSEETGLEIEINRFYGFREMFFYYNPLDEAFHSFLFFYLCRPLSLEVCTDEAVDDGEVERPRWVAWRGLAVEDFQNHGDLILEILADASRDP